MSFPPFLQVFLAKSQKIFKIGEVRKFDGEFCEKKRFRPFKRHLQQSWKAENVPLGAGHLVSCMHGKSFFQPSGFAEK